VGCQSVVDGSHRKQSRSIVVSCREKTTNDQRPTANDRSLQIFTHFLRKAGLHIAFFTKGTEVCNGQPNDSALRG
jgi:hypothetical protein